MTTAPGENVDVVQAPVWGLVRAAQSKHVGRFVLVDTDAEGPADEAVLAAAATGELELALRGVEPSELKDSLPGR